jgi:hypothetical protein
MSVNAALRVAVVGPGGWGASTRGSSAAVRTPSWLRSSEGAANTTPRAMDTIAPIAAMRIWLSPSDECHSASGHFAETPINPKTAMAVVSAASSPTSSVVDRLGLTVVC